eukprot:CAMPEP_0116995800 /NCGR_PEP_ID=MMETSP0467-20121206/69018_1 /TAXON_ID=283647 /ORGANISM="Mesodinium pulex, Strain SPMC105" /LENGTH=153 /DNA_ID=CAMNT_0004694281 /DNA_START=970 /DNA_END=1431 /DNA_ORIENTATION=+
MTTPNLMLKQNELKKLVINYISLNKHHNKKLEEVAYFEESCRELRLKNSGRTNINIKEEHNSRLLNDINEEAIIEHVRPRFQIKTQKEDSDSDIEEKHYMSDDEDDEDEDDNERKNKIIDDDDQDEDEDGDAIMTAKDKYQNQNINKNYKNRQ